MKKFILFACSLIIILSGCTAKDSAKTQDSGDLLNQETDHFTIRYQEQDKGCLEDLSTGLEYAYTKVTEDLQHPLNYKVEVTVFPELQLLKDAIGLSEADDYTSAGTIGKSIYIVSPMNPGPVRTYDHMINSSTLHEFTHVVVNDIRKSDTWPEEVPRWLNEGIACYEGGYPGPKEYMDVFVSNSVLSEQIPTFADISGYGEEFRTANGYYFTLPAGTFFVETYGFEKVKKLIEKPGEYKEIFGKTDEELHAEWVEYLKDNYS